MVAPVAPQSGTDFGGKTFLDISNSNICTFPDVLPIVEFVLEDGITHDEAMALMQSDHEAPRAAVVPSAPRWDATPSASWCPATG